MIHRITTSWIKSVEGDVLNMSFADAWSNVVNALNGVWGDITYRPFKGVEAIEMDVSVMKSKFIGELDTTLEGSQTFVMPYVLVEAGKLTIEVVSGGIVTSTIVYVIDQSTSLNPEELAINLPSGRKLITVTGKARRT